jgi:hypothetical protein
MAVKFRIQLNPNPASQVVLTYDVYADSFKQSQAPFTFFTQFIRGTNIVASFTTTQILSIVVQ